jgi:type IV secretory pathway VirB3-like protein
MQPPSARLGSLWIQESVQIFFRRPLSFLGLCITYMVFNLLLSLVPTVLGMMLPLVVAPILLPAFLVACAYVDHDKRFFPDLLLVGFRSKHLGSLLGLGLFNALVVVVALLSSTLVDNGVLWQAMTGRLNPEQLQTRLQDPAVFYALATSFFVYGIGYLISWFSPALVFWRKMSVLKALSLSAFAVCRYWLPFLVFGAIWTLLFGFLPTAVATLLLSLTGNKEIISLAVVLLAMMLWVLMQCGVYASYKAVFLTPVVPSPEDEETAA